MLVVCLAFVGAPRARAAPSPDERLLSLARLWGDVRYFDPWIAYRDVDWDAAALAAIPQVESASSSAAYGAAVQTMLATLQDPFTGVAPFSGALGSSNGDVGLTLTTPNDRTAILTIAPTKIATASDAQLENPNGNSCARARFAPNHRHRSAHAGARDRRPILRRRLPVNHHAGRQGARARRPSASDAAHAILQRPTQPTRCARQRVSHSGGFMADDAKIVRGKADTPHKIAFLVNANASSDLGSPSFARAKPPSSAKARRRRSSAVPSRASRLPTT